MVGVRAHYDGKVFVPDEPVDLRPGTSVRLLIAPVTTGDRLDRSAFTVGTLDDDDAALWWGSRTPEERLAALEFLRQVTYGYDPVADRIPRILEVAELEGR